MNETAKPRPLGGASGAKEESQALESRFS